MAADQFDRTTSRIRELLIQYKNRDAVIRVLVSQGMDQTEATARTLGMFRENRSINRKSSLGTLIGGGLVTAILLGVLVATGRLFYIWLPLSGLTFLWGLVKFLTASGYEVEEED